MTALHHEADTVIEPAAILAYGPRPDQVDKALRHLEGMLDVWAAEGQLAALDSYLARRVPGDAHPLPWVKQYQPFNQAARAAATMLRYPHGGAA